MANEKRYLRALMLAALLPLAAARAQVLTTPPGLDTLPDESLASPDAGLVPTEVDLQRADGGFALQGVADGGTQPAFEAPALVVDSPASYPEALSTQPVEGMVRLELLVDEQGEVAEVRLLQGLHPLLDEAALHAAPGLRFSPAKVEGSPVPVRLHFEYRFEDPRQVAGAEKPPAPVTLRGLIRAKGNRRPLVGAVLVSEAAPDSPVETGPDGRFEARLPPGIQTVRVSAPGHKPGAFREEVRPGEALEVVYGLEPLVVNPYETVVRGDRERTEVSRVTLHEAELREIPGTMGDPFRVMMLMPGVSSMISGVSYPVLRGSQPAATGYFLDGIRVPLLFHLFLGPAVIHPDFVDSIDFFPGNPSTQYGRLTGGAVEGKLTRPRDDRFHGSAYADFINAGLFVEYPFQSTGTNISVAGRISYTAWVAALAANALQLSGANDSKLVLDFYDYQARIEQEVGPGRLRLFAFGSSDTFGSQAKTDEGFTALQSVLFHRVDLRYRHPVGGGELEAGVTWGLDRLSITSEQPRLGGITAHIDQRDLTARLSYQRGFGEGITLRSGLDVDHKRALMSIEQRSRLSTDVPFEETRRELPLAIATFSGLWAELLWEKHAPWTLVPGVRVDNYHLAGGINNFVAEPRLSVRRKMSEQLSLKGGVGLYHQPPTTLISLPIIDIAALDQGLQQALQVSLGAEYKDLWGFDVSLEGYVNPMLRTVELTPFGDEDTPFIPPDLPGVEDPSTGRPPPGTGGRRFVRAMAQEQNPFPVPLPVPLPEIDLSDVSSRGLSYGLELLIRRPLGGNWFGWLSYSLQRSTRRVRFTRGNGEKVEADLPYVFDQTHVANLVLSYKFGNNFTVGGVLHFNTGRPESGNLTSRTQVEGTDDLGLPRWVQVDRDRVERLPPFFRFDLRLSKAWAYETFTLEAYLDMLNVTISHEVVSFNYGGGNGAPLQKLPVGVPIVLPILGLKGRY
ncbi:TonB family protein [Archangium sp.]|uniref:TonB family protein n=1 Tax=Archangium sp. TaxID=1872627 RepID=UPI002D2AE52A|nr:TonB family protein [Archangium sp.]HYO59511.1 TonB family protein [Archangium sp.]